MANNLVKNAKAFQVTAFDLNPAALEKIQSCGANVATSVDEATENADVIITMLPNTSHVQDVYDFNKLQGRISQDCMMIDCR